MGDDAESYSQAEIVRLLKGITSDVATLRGEVHALGGTFVTRAEHEAWRTAYDREIKQIKDDAAAREAATAPVRVSGWTIAGFGLSAVVGLGSLLGLLITLINVIP